MTVDLNIGDLLTGLAAVAGVAITIFTALNSRARLHKVAQQSMELASSLNEQANTLRINSRARSRAVGLYNELVFHSHYATQRYSHKTTPKALTLIETVANALFSVLLAFATWNLQGIPAEWEMQRSFIGWAFIVAAVWISVRGIMTSRRTAAVQSALEAKATDFMEEEPEQKRVPWLALAAGISLSTAALATLVHRKRNQ